MVLFLVLVNICTLYLKCIYNLYVYIACNTYAYNIYNVYVTCNIYVYITYMYACVCVYMYIKHIMSYIDNRMQDKVLPHWAYGKQIKYHFLEAISCLRLNNYSVILLLYGLPGCSSWGPFSFSLLQKIGWIRQQKLGHSFYNMGCRTLQISSVFKWVHT